MANLEGEDGANTEYHCEDFDWEELRKEIESTQAVNGSLCTSESSVVQGDLSTSSKDAWQRFHERHFRVTFFKERRYLLKEFPELQNAPEDATVLEVGCGNGSSVLPILRANRKIEVYACDCSSVALERAREIVDVTIGERGSSRFHPFCCDLSVESFPDWLHSMICRDSKAGKHETMEQGSSICQKNGLDIVTLIFTLSALPFKRMPHVINECFSILKPGGLLLFRDYGLYDMTMLRFPASQKVGECQYIRKDGTYSYYFTPNSLRDLFTRAGFVEVESRFCCVQLLNRKKGNKMQRVWVHAKFQKPSI